MGPRESRLWGIVSMRKALLSGLAAALMVVSMPASAGTPKNILLETARPVPDAREVHVYVGQEEIAAEINPSQVSMVTGGGLLGALIDIQIQAERAKKAEAAIQPIRTALQGFDVDALAEASARSAIEKMPWFQPGEMTFSRDTSASGRIAVLDAARTSQVALITFVYDVSPDFSAIRVLMAVEFAPRDTPQGKSATWRLTNGIVYRQSVTSVVQLVRPATDINYNAGVWAENGGARARRALTLAFAKVAELAPRATLITQADAKAMNSKPHKAVVVAGFAGRQQDSDDGGTLLFNGGYVHIQTLEEQA